MRSTPPETEFCDLATASRLREDKQVQQAKRHGHTQRDQHEVNC